MAIQSLSRRVNHAAPEGAGSSSRAHRFTGGTSMGNEGRHRSDRQRYGALRIQGVARSRNRKVRQLCRRCQLYLDPYRHFSAVLLRFRYCRTGLSVVLANGIDRPAHGRAVLHGTGRQIPGCRIGLQLVQTAGQPHRELVRGLADAHRLDRYAICRGARGCNTQPATLVERLSNRWRWLRCL